MSFQLRTNVVSDEADRTSAGRLFQSRGPAVANDRSPTDLHDKLVVSGRAYASAPDIVLS